MNYTDINAKTVDSWVQNGWEWGRPISHETFEKAKNGEWGVYLTPTKIVPHEWFGEMKGKKILLVDDVISTGESIAALEKLVNKAGGIVCGKETILAEGDAKNRGDITYLKPLPVFHPDGTPKES